MLPGLLFILVLALVLGPLLSYNRFVTQRELLTSAWADIDTELKRRYSLIPELIDTVTSVAPGAAETLRAMSDAREAGLAAPTGPVGQGAAQAAVQDGLRRVFSLVDRHPELSANQRFLDLRHELTSIENRIEGSRGFYNANAQELNRRIRAFPSGFIARQFGFAEAEPFEPAGGLVPPSS